MFKKFKKLFLVLVIATFIMPQSILAYSDYIAIGGENIGLQINNKGIIVAGFYEINGKKPAEDAGLKQGDIILKVDSIKINNINDFVKQIEDSNHKYIKLEYKRNDKIYNTTLTLEMDGDVLKTGIFVKDTISGIGTLTYIDPKTKIYGALGHEVIESETSIMVDVLDGKIYNSTVTDIDKSKRGIPGSKNAKVDENSVLGNINENTKSGIFGKYENDFQTNNLYKVANKEDITLSNAKIITVINNNEKKEYDIKILKLNNNGNKNILFEIIDDDLLNKTGGIIQGMSGSPIIQNDKIIGAVTNVVVDNPKRGYGIYITTMLKEGEN